MPVVFLKKENITIKNKTNTMSEITQPCLVCISNRFEGLEDKRPKHQMQDFIAAKVSRYNYRLSRGEVDRNFSNLYDEILRELQMKFPGEADKFTHFIEMEELVIFWNNKHLSNIY